VIGTAANIIAGHKAGGNDLSWFSKARSAAAKPAFPVFILLLIKFCIARIEIFGDFNPANLIGISAGSILAAVMLVELLAGKRKFLWLMVVNLLFTGIAFAAIMYHKYYGVIVTYRALAQAGQVFQVRASVMTLTAPYYLLLFADIVILSILYPFSRKFRTWPRNRARSDRRIAAGLLGVSILVCCLNIFTNTSIYNEVTKAKRMGIINYEVYEIVKALTQPQESNIRVSAAAVRQVKNVLPLTDEETKLRGIAAGRNVIVIQMESMQNFLIGLTVDGKEITPNLNRLLETALYFPRIYQQVGQGNTSDSEYMLNTSLYVPPDGAASQIYTNKQLPSMPRILKPYGYESMTFHTNDIKFWNRDRLYPALGIDRMFDDDFFGEDQLVAFGASDDVLYEKTLPVLLENADQGKRFYANVISMSAHHPFHLPETMAELDLPEPYKETLVGRYLISQHYADAALGRFIEALKQTVLWENSVIMIYGDHLGLPMYSMEDEDFQLMESLIGREYSYADMLNIPLIIAVPGALEEGSRIPHVGGHVDFMPTLANLLGISLEDRVYFGQDLVNQPHNLLPERYYLPTGSFINDEVIFIPEEQFSDGKAYPLTGDAPVKPRSEWADEFRRAMQLLRMSEAYVESLPDLDV
jgi:phosphoglycerol transferase MdoB-like AlkP superfamily enzyme